MNTVVLLSRLVEVVVVKAALLCTIYEWLL